MQKLQPHNKISKIYLFFYRQFSQKTDSGKQIFFFAFFEFFFFPFFKKPKSDLFTYEIMMMCKSLLELVRFLRGNYFAWDFNTQIQIDDEDKCVDDLIGAIDPYAHYRLNLSSNIIWLQYDNNNIASTSTSNV